MPSLLWGILLVSVGAGVEAQTLAQCRPGPPPTRASRVELQHPVAPLLVSRALEMS